MRHPFFRFMVNMTVLGLTLLMLGLIGAMAVFYHYSNDLPDYKHLAQYEPPIITRLYAADGKLMAEYATQRRIYVPLSAIPRRVIQAFISAEDKNFYQHDGIDPSGIIRAIRENITNQGRGRLVGGSTITQQVVKNFLLTSEQSFERKIKEAILAFRISHTYSKDRILELYLNQIYLGNGSYGVAAAALNYFNKSLDELTTEEAAFLAALPKAPANYHPLKFYERAKARRDWVIHRMQEDGYITGAEAIQFTAQPILLLARNAAETVSASFFAEEVRRRLAAMFGTNVLYEGGLMVKTTLSPHLQAYADQALQNALIAYDRRHGYRGAVSTLATIGDWNKSLRDLPENVLTLPLLRTQQWAVVLKLSDKQADIGLRDGSTAAIPLKHIVWARKQLPDLVLGAPISKPADALNVGDVIIAEAVLDESAPPKDTNKNADAKPVEYKLAQVPQVNGAMVVMDPHTGRTLALTGGYAYGRTEFNRATQAKRQPGSAFKPFVYLAALERGFLPTSIVLDAPVELSQGAGLPSWKPQNYKDEYLGPTTLRRGIEKSRNTMTVRLAQALGIDKILTIGKRFGIYDAPPRNFSIVLGAAETTLLRLTSAYATLANGGFRVTPALIERIDDRNGKTIFRRDMRACSGCSVTTGTLPDSTTPPLPPDTRERIVDARIAYQITSILEGVVQRGTATKALAIGKPVAGKTGTTNDSRDTWFVGYSPDLAVGVFIGFDTPKPMGAKETGGAVALPAFVEFMQNALKDEPAKPFRVPEGIQQIKIDYVSGHPVAEKSESSRVILESFLAGGEIFIPEAEKKDEKPITPLGLPQAAEPTPAETENLPPMPLDEEELDHDREPEHHNRYLPNSPYSHRRRPAENPGNEGTGGFY